MKRIFYAIAALVLCGSAADAGPLRCVAQNVKERIEYRIEQVKERVEHRVEQVKQRVQSRPIVRQVRSDVTAVANSRPVAKFVYGVANVAAVRATNCPGGVCPK